MDPPLLDLLLRWADAGERHAVASAIATRLGCDRVLLLIEDPDLGVLVPAPGFPQTIDGGASWRRFVAACSEPGRHTAPVELPRGRTQPAVALRHSVIAAVLVGGEPAAEAIGVIEQLLPLLCALLRTEQRSQLDAARVADACEVADRAQALAAALETSRAEASRLNAQLREADRRKDEFLAMLAHELRNPLAPIVMAVELMRRPDAPPGLRERQLAILARQVQQMTRLVEDLLDVSRVSRGRIELRRQRIPVRTLIHDAVQAIRPLLASRDQRLTVSSTAEPLAVDGDPIRLTQVLTNLLHNAAKFTQPGGRLALHAERCGDQVLISLQDSGIGIAAEMLPRIFDLFTQVPVTIDRSRGGLGIGLTLVRTLVELHGGEVAVESPGVGLGSTFSVRLPLAASSREAPAVEAPSLPAASGGGLRVLVVDDNQDAADSVAEILRVYGHRTEVAYDAEAALRVADRFPADLILLDLGLPGIDGFELARRLRRTIAPGTRLVALTGYGSDADRRRSQAAGFDEHLVKPVLCETLEALLRRTPGRR